MYERKKKKNTIYNFWILKIFLYIYLFILIKKKKTTVKSYIEAMDEIDNLQSKTDSCLVIDGESLQVRKKKWRENYIKFCNNANDYLLIHNIIYSYALKVVKKIL